MNKGDTVQLITPQQGRRYTGRITKIEKEMITATLPNGYYVTLPQELWEITNEIKEDDDCEEVETEE